MDCLDVGWGSVSMSGQSHVAYGMVVDVCLSLYNAFLPQYLVPVSGDLSSKMYDNLFILSIPGLFGPMTAFTLTKYGICPRKILATSSVLTGASVFVFAFVPQTEFQTLVCGCLVKYFTYIMYPTL